MTSPDVTRRYRVVRGYLSPLTENLGYKIVAVALALVLMVSVKGAGVVTRSVDVPVTALLPLASNHGRVLVSPMPDSVKVTVRGPSSLVGSLRGDQLGPMQIDLRDGARRTLLLDEDFVRLPRGVQVVSFVPSRLELLWDTLVTRSLPVRAAVAGSPGPRLRVSGISVEPSQVSVRGPAAEVEPLDGVRTQEVDVSTLAIGHHERRVNLVVGSPMVGLVSTTRVRVSFDVVAMVAERRFERLSVAVLGGARADVRPPVVDVVVRGDPDAVAALLPSQVVPYVEPTEGHRGSETVAVHLHPLPGTVASVSADPTQVVVTIAR